MLKGYYGQWCKVCKIFEKNICGGNIMQISVILFDDFTALDAFGPVEVFSLPEYKISYHSLRGGMISNRQGINIMTEDFSNIPEDNIILIPGGMGTRKHVYDVELIGAIKKLAVASKYCLTVCTGSALLAQTGLLDGKKATSNKHSLNWVKGFGKDVQWDETARYVQDGKYYTASGVSAGIDMALAFIKDYFDEEKVAAIRARMEYRG